MKHISGAYRIVSLAALFFALGVLAGCALPKAPSKADARMVYVWPVDECPSQVGKSGPTHFAPLIAALGVTLLSDSVNALLGVPAGALANAAAADKNGFSMAGTNARYYFAAGSAPTPTNPAQNSPALKAPGCYIVALAQPREDGTSNSVDWCNDAKDARKPAFHDSVPDTCKKDGRSVIDSLSTRELFRLDGTSAVPRNSAASTLTVPELYAEIAFDDSSYTDVVLPKIVAIYYPQSLLNHDQTKARTVAISVDISSALATDPFKAASLVIVLPHVVPGAILAPAIENAQTGWAVRPLHNISVASGVDLSVIEKNHGRYLPVTMKGTIAEAGDPSLFLASFAQAFGGQASVSALSNALMNSISLTGAPSTDAQALQNAQISYQKSLGQALVSASQVTSACAAPKPLSAAAKMNAQGLFDQAVSSQVAANLAAQIAFVSPPFSNPQAVSGIDASCWR